MNSSQPRLIQTFLLDGTLEGARIIELSESAVKAFVIPRLRLGDVRDRPELLWPSLYFLLSSDDDTVYVGESENFYHRVKNHDQHKQFWDIAVAIVSTTNSLEKSDVKYLESLAVERAQGGSMHVENKTIPARNNIHEFKLHTLQRILDDAQLITTSLGYDVLSPKEQTEHIWYCTSKLTKARAAFRGDSFVVFAGTVIDKTHADSWLRAAPEENIERQEMFRKYGEDQGETVLLKENVSFKSPNHAGRIVNGRSVNAWTTWKNAAGQTMDEVMRRVRNE